jgi:hypothetical protein
LHVLGVSIPDAHAEPQFTVLPGYVHAPVELQSVAPHVPAVVHATVQQRDPVPLGPHKALVH